MKIKCYKTNQLFTESFFKNHRIDRSEINEKTWTKLDDTNKSIKFYRNIRSPYICSKNLCDGIVSGLEKYFFENDGFINKSTKETIIDILLETEENKYELLLTEHITFKKLMDSSTDQKILSPRINSTQSPFSVENKKRKLKLKVMSKVKKRKSVN
jgi:hypothetical protein